MADIDDSSLLGDILAASSRPGPAKADPIPARARLELEDLLRLDDAAWTAFIAAAAPDDLVVACAAGSPAWRARVLTCLDQVSSDWLRSNIAALDAVGPALRDEARERLMSTAKSLQRDGTLTLPAPLATPAAPSQAPAAPRQASAPLPAVPNPAPKPAAPTRPAAYAPPQVSIGFASAPGSNATVIPVATVHPAGAADEAPVRSEADGRLDELFDDLVRLRDQSGTAALAPLASEVSDPFLAHGLSLVAAGMPVAELERALDSELAKQAEAYLNQLMRTRERLLALAAGS